MTVPSAVLAFAGIAALLTLVPGVDTALVLRSVVAQGRRSAAWTTVGIATGVLVWGVAAAVGVAALLAASRLAYDVVRLAGAAYLVLLGLRMLVAAVRGDRRGRAAVPAPRRSALRAWSAGVGTNLLNPKVGVFYLATLPQFLVPGVPPLAMGLLLAGVHVLLGFVWLGALIVAAGFATRWLARPAVTRTITGVTGGVLVLFGVRTALERA